MNPFLNNAAIYQTTYEKVEQMRNEFRNARLTSLNHKMIAGLALSTKEMLERELLAAAYLAAA